MNRDSLHDVVLQALEARLGGLSPKLPSAEQQRLMYRCAFAAGQSDAKRTLRWWQGATAMLMLLLVGATIPMARERSPLAKVPAQPLLEKRTIERKEIEQEMPLVTAHGRIAVPFDAWQSAPSPLALFDDELVQFAQLSPRLRSLSVGAMTHQNLEE